MKKLERERRKRRGKGGEITCREERETEGERGTEQVERRH